MGHIKFAIVLKNVLTSWTQWCACRRPSRRQSCRARRRKLEINLPPALKASQNRDGLHSSDEYVSTLNAILVLQLIARLAIK